MRCIVRKRLCSYLPPQKWASPPPLSTPHIQLCDSEKRIFPPHAIYECLPFYPTMCVLCVLVYCMHVWVWARGGCVTPVQGRRPFCGGGRDRLQKEFGVRHFCESFPLVQSFAGSCMYSQSKRLKYSVDPWIERCSSCRHVTRHPKFFEAFN